MKQLIFSVFIFLVFASLSNAQLIKNEERLPLSNRSSFIHELERHNSKFPFKEKNIERHLLNEKGLIENEPFQRNPRIDRIDKRRKGIFEERNSEGSFGKEKRLNLRKELNEKGIQGATAESIYVAWVKHYESGLGSSKINSASDIAIDAYGNVYVTGYTRGSSTFEDYATIKYNTNGVEQWVQRYNGPGNSSDVATAIAVDASGNVYMTGGSSGSGTSVDYATIKYNTNGVEQWVQRYNGPGNSDDRAYAIAIDASGNVYVTGYSYGSGTFYDYATIKYNTNGVEQWVQRYNGPGNFYDDATAIAVDGSGNVYVTGYSYGSGTFYDYATIKYNTNGVEQWVQRYNGPGNDRDGANAIAVDGSGDVYVTGSSYGSGTSSDYATIKYNTNGVEQWVQRYNGPGNDRDGANAIAVDASGNVYVTGWSGGSGTFYDYATIKYNTNGVEQWVQRYNGPGNDWDEANAIAVDGSGNVYVTGRSYGLGTSSDYATIKYNTNGVEQWVQRYNGPGNDRDGANAIAVDGSGNVYVTGSSYGSGTSSDYATIKYNTNGVEQWVQRYNGPGNDYDEAYAIAVDASGNVYVTGGSGGSGTFYDYATIKYNTNGVEQWVQRYNGPGNSDDWATAIAVDISGNVYVTGGSYGSGTSRDYATIKYNTNGVEQWVQRYSGDESIAIAVDASGNVYVTGSSQSYGFSILTDYATIKYNTNGVEQWVQRYNGPGNDYDGARAIAVDGSGNVYVTGSSYGSGTSSDYATIKYNTNGLVQWVQRYNGPGNFYDYAHAIAVDLSGNVYVTGGSAGSGTSDDYATIKYNTNGLVQWVQRYNGPGNSDDWATAIAVDISGNVYVTGRSQSYGFSILTDYATIKYNTNGVEQWVQRYNGPGNDYDGARAIAVDGSGNVYVTGYSVGSGWSIYTTIKYTPQPVSVEEDKSNLPSAYHLFHNYPNPFNPSTTIKYAIPERAKVNLSIYNLLGEKIAELVNGELEAGYHETKWNVSASGGLPSGIYFYTLVVSPIEPLQAGKSFDKLRTGFVETKKLILMK